jgi:endonuclease/exonuclease/phosphatase family metal-dependent hydrolase
MRVFICVLLATTWLAVGCGGDSKEDVTPDTLNGDVTGEVSTSEVMEEVMPEVVEPVPPYSLITYNVGLAYNYVTYAAERKAAILDAIANLDADFVCLQEVWETDDVDDVMAAALEAFPYQHYADTTAEPGETDPACTEDETDPLLACYYEFCDGTDDLTGCIMENCVDPFTAVTKPCSNCLVANIAKPIEDIVQSCLEGSAAFTAEGRTGLILLSRHAFDSTDNKVLDSYIVRRAILHARVVADSGPLNVFCTHLSTEISEIEYDGKSDSYDDEQGDQIVTIVAYAEKQAGEEPSVIMGDMNCGPEVAPNIVSKNTENFQHYLDAGYSVPFLAQEQVDCSWCIDNALTGSGVDRLIDHILVKNLGDYEAELVVERILDEVVTVPHSDTGEDVVTPLSDHYGVHAYLP